MGMTEEERNKIRVMRTFFLSLQNRAIEIRTTTEWIEQEAQEMIFKVDKLLENNPT